MKLFCMFELYPPHIYLFGKMWAVIYQKRVYIKARVAIDAENNKQFMCLCSS